MMRKWLVLIPLCTAAIASAQVAEISASSGISGFFGKGGLLGTSDVDITSPNIAQTNGFRLGFRFTVNPYRFFGHEFGFGYNRSNVRFEGDTSQDVSVPIYQGVYDFLAYATPEGTRIRPFLAGGVQFSSFFPPGSDVYSGNQVTKFGFNYGGGIKTRFNDTWGLRLDFRQYNSGKPFDFPNNKGRLKQTEVSAGVSFNF